MLVVRLWEGLEAGGQRAGESDQGGEGLGGDPGTDDGSGHGGRGECRDGQEDRWSSTPLR